MFERAGLSTAAAETTALIGMTLVIAHLSLLLGELVPMPLAMQRSVGFPKLLAPPLSVFATLMRPVIWLLSVSTNLVVRLVGGFVTDRLGRVARPGDVVDVDGHRLEVLVVDRSRVERVEITRLRQDAAEERPGS